MKIYHTLILMLIAIPLLDARREEGGHDWVNLMVRDPWERDQKEIGGDGTQVPRILVYANDGGYQTVYMGIDTAGVYRSDDGGYHWESKMKGMSAYFVQGIAVDPVATNRIYALANAHPLIHSPIKGLYVSNDRAESWDFVKNFKLGDTRRLTVNLIAIFPDSYSPELGVCSEIILGTAQGVYVSRDGGESFSHTGGSTIGKREVRAVHVDSFNPDIVYVGTVDGIFRSLDRGDSFQRYDDGIKGKVLVTSLTVANEENPRLMAVINDNKIYRKTHGEEWVDITLGHGLPDLGKSWGYYYEVQSHPAAPDRVMLGVARNARIGSPWYSEDFGESWELRNHRIRDERFNVGSRHDRSHNLVPALAMGAHPENEDQWIKAFNFGTVFRTFDAAKTWEWSNQNYGGFRGMQLIANPGDPNHFVINSVDLGPLVTFDGGQSFERAYGERYHRVDSLGGAILNDGSPSREATVYVGIGKHAAHLDGVLQKSTDGGLNFHIVPGTEGKQKAYVMINPQDPNYIYAGDVVTMNGGLDWFPAGEGTGAQVFGFDPQDPDTVYLFNGEVLYVSYNAGRDVEVLHDLGYKGRFGEAFIPSAALNNAGNRIYVGHRGGLYIYDLESKNVSFKNENDGFIRDASGELDLKSVVIDPTNDDIIYAGEFSLTDGQGSWVFQSTDGGESWVSLNTESYQGRGRVWGMGIDGYGVVWAFTDHGPFWYGDVCVPGVVEGVAVTAEPEGNRIRWNAVEGAYTYQVKRGASPGGEFEVIQGGWPHTTFVDEEAPADRVSYYRIAAGNIAGEGPESAPAYGRHKE